MNLGSNANYQNMGEQKTDDDEVPAINLEDYNVHAQKQGLIPTL